MSLPQRWLPAVNATCPFVGALSSDVAAFGAGWRSGVSVKSPLQVGARLRLFNELIMRTQKKRVNRRGLANRLVNHAISLR